MRTCQQTRWKLDNTAIENNTVAEEIVGPPALNDIWDIVDTPEQEIDRHSDTDKTPYSLVKVGMMRMGVLVPIPLHWLYRNQLGSIMCLNDTMASFLDH